MKNFCVYNPSTGQIFRTGSCSDGDLPYQSQGDLVALVVEEIVKDSECYIENGQVVRMAIKPSVHHIFDYTSKQWADPRTLADFQTSKWLEIKELRDQAEFGGFIWDGLMFDSTSISQSRIQGASQLATLAMMNTQSFNIDWTLADNTIRTLSAQDMLAVGQALGVHINTQHGKARQKRVEINTATTVEEIMAISW